jgi:hypothetical protein
MTLIAKIFRKSPLTPLLKKGAPHPPPFLNGGTRGISSSPFSKEGLRGISKNANPINKFEDYQHVTLTMKRILTHLG